MKIELPEGEFWRNEKILVIGIGTTAMFLRRDGILHAPNMNSNNGKTIGKVVEIERLNDEYCAVRIADEPMKHK